MRSSRGIELLLRKIVRIEGKVAMIETARFSLVQFCHAILKIFKLQ